MFKQGRDRFFIYLWSYFFFYFTVSSKILRSKIDTYDDVVERVAHQLGVDDPSKIRLTPHNCYSQQPKPHFIKYRGAAHLLDMLIHYNQVAVTSVERIVILMFTFCEIMLCITHKMWENYLLLSAEQLYWLPL